MILLNASYGFLVSLLFLACSKSTSTNPVNVQLPMVTNIIRVSSASQLQSALNNARPGDEIVMADGTYNGKFIIPPTVHGTAQATIILRGSRNAILDAGNINTGYVLHAQGSYWLLKGFSITNGLKGVMADGVRYTIFDSLKVFNIGEEGIHLRKFSSQNTIRQCEVLQTGLKTADYGEGIYVGSAKNNWAAYTNGLPDRCDSNKILFNKVGPGITAECIDIKEGTTGGLIQENSFDATGITGANAADSWIDVKGNNYLIQKNYGHHAGGNIFKDGYQAHVAISGWGNNNEFRENNCTVNASGYGFYIQLSGSNGTSTGNKVFANNIVTGAAKGVANIPVSN